MCLQEDIFLHTTTTVADMSRPVLPGFYTWMENFWWFIISKLTLSLSSGASKHKACQLMRSVPSDCLDGCFINIRKPVRWEFYIIDSLMDFSHPSYVYCRLKHLGMVLYPRSTTLTVASINLFFNDFSRYEEMKSPLLAVKPISYNPFPCPESPLPMCIF